MSPEDWVKLEIVLISTSLLLVAFSFLVPQYEIVTSSGSDPFTGRPMQRTVETFYFDFLKVKSSTYAYSETVSYSYDQASPADYTDVGHFMANEKLWLACWLFLGWMLLIVMSFGRMLAQIVIGWMAVIASLVAVAYPVTEVSGAIPKISGFLGSSPSAGATVSWGPSTGWFLSILGCILVSAVVVHRMSGFFMAPPKAADQIEAGSQADVPLEELLR